MSTDYGQFEGKFVRGNKKKSPVGETVYTQMGEAIHAMVQGEMALSGNLYAAEAAVVDVQNKFVGRIDMITTSGEVVEIKSVSLSELMSMHEPRHEHKLQLGYYLGAIGARKGKILYVAREAPYVRKSFNVLANDALYQMGKAYILGRRESINPDMSYSFKSAMEDQPTIGEVAANYLKNVKDHKKLSNRLQAARKRQELSKSISMAQHSGDKDEHNYLPGMQESGLGRSIRRLMTGFGSGYKSYFQEPQRTSNKKFEGTGSLREKPHPETYKLASPENMPIVLSEGLKKGDEGQHTYGTKHTYFTPKNYRKKTFGSKSWIKGVKNKDAYKLARTAIKEGGLEKPTVRLWLDMETAVIEGITDRWQPRIWEMATLVDKTQPIIGDRELKRQASVALQSLRKRKGEALITQEEFKVEARKYHTADKWAKNFNQPLMGDGSPPLKTFRALHLDEATIDIVKEAKHIDHLISRGVMDKRDKQWFEEIAKRTDAKDALEFIQQDVIAYERVARDKSGQLAAYNHITEQVEKGEMGKTKNLGKYFSSEKHMLQDAVQHMHNVQRAVSKLDAPIPGGERYAYAVAGHNVSSFDINTLLNRANILFSEEEKKAYQISDEGLFPYVEDSLKNSEMYHASHQAASKESDFVRKLSKTRGWEGRPDASLSNRVPIKLEEMTRDLMVMDLGDIQKFQHRANVDVMVNALVKDAIDIAGTDKNLTKMILANAQALEAGKKGAVDETRYLASKIMGNFSLEDALQFYGPGRMSVGEFARETGKVPFSTTPESRIKKTLGAQIKPYFEGFVDKIAGEGSFAEASEIVRQGGTLANKAYDTLGKYVTKAENVLGIKSKIGISQGSKGLIALGAMAVGMVGAMTLWDQPSFSNQPFRPSSPKVSTPSGNDEAYRDKTFDGQGISKDIRQRMTDFGSGYSSSKGSTLGHIHSIDTRPNLSIHHDSPFHQVRAHHPSVPSLGGKFSLGRLNTRAPRAPRVTQVNFPSSLKFPKLKDVDSTRFKRQVKFRKLSSQGTEPLFRMYHGAIGHRQM